MNKLIATIELIRGKLETLRRHSLKETPTRTIVVDPLLEAMGWDVRDPEEVQLEYPTIDGKSVDYALMINRKPVLLVEAKALDDPLDDVKAITQVVGYAANGGIVWCALTNGIRWKVYRSVEKCPAPDKLMFEVSLDPREAQDMSVHELAKGLWRLSREQMAEGTLDTLGEQTFTDGKVRKALNQVVADPPAALLKAIRKAAKDEALKPQRIRESLARIWPGVAAGEAPPAPITARPTQRSPKTPARSQAGPKTRKPRRVVPPKHGTHYDESRHTSGKPQEVLEIYRAIDRACLSMSPESIEKQYRNNRINYCFSNFIFCVLRIRKSKVDVWLTLPYAAISNPPSFARDVSNLGHWRLGDVQLAVRALSQVDEAIPLIRQSFESVAGTGTHTA